MFYDYWRLKEALRIKTNALLSVFEQYCIDMRANTRILEWTCKICDGAFEGARFLHTARFPEYSRAQSALDRLYDSLAHESGLIEPRHTQFLALRPMAEQLGQGVALGYAEHGTTHDRRIELKLYISTGQIDVVRPLIAQLVPPGAVPPVTLSRVMIAASVDDQKASGSRVYYLWRQPEIRQSSSAEWLNRWCTAEEVRLIKDSSSMTVAISFKAGRRDMVYFAAPFRQPEINALVVEHLTPFPLAYDQLEHLRWIGFSKWKEGLAAREVNFYFNCVS